MRQGFFPTIEMENREDILFYWHGYLKRQFEAISLEEKKFLDYWHGKFTWKAEKTFSDYWHGKEGIHFQTIDMERSEEFSNYWHGKEGRHFQTIDMERREDINRLVTLKRGKTFSEYCHGILIITMERKGRYLLTIDINIERSGRLFPMEHGK